MGQILERIPVINRINLRQAIPGVPSNRIPQRSKFVSARMLRPILVNQMLNFSFTFAKVVTRNFQSNALSYLVKAGHHVVAHLNGSSKIQSLQEAVDCKAVSYLVIPCYNIHLLG